MAVAVWRGRVRVFVVQLHRQANAVDAPISPSSPRRRGSSDLALRSQATSLGVRLRRSKARARLRRDDGTRVREGPTVARRPGRGQARYSPAPASNRSATSDSGTTDCAAPIATAAPGMPQITLVSWSWASVSAPAWRRASSPRAPSSPMPVSRAALTLAPAQRASDSNITSTLGRWPRTGSSSPSRQCQRAPLRYTRRWRPPGAT